MVVLSPLVSQKLTQLRVKGTREALDSLKGRLEVGAITPVIDRYYKLSEVAEALRYLEQGHARGEIVITV